MASKTRNTERHCLASTSFRKTTSIISGVSVSMSRIAIAGSCLTMPDEMACETVIPCTGSDTVDPDDEDTDFPELDDGVDGVDGGGDVEADGV